MNTVDDLGLLPPRELDPALYHPDAEEVEFFKSQTGIQDEDDLKTHILTVQAEAYKVFPYPCIMNFEFARLKISRLPAYPDLLRLGREKKDAIFIDIGCCFGNDTRKAVADGFPAENIVASDLRQEFWDLGHTLYRSTPAKFPVPFVAGDVFDTAYIARGPPATLTGPPPALSALTSLVPLRGRAHAVHASLFFHLFNAAGQAAAAAALGALLAPAPGALLFGEHRGVPDGAPAGVRTYRGGEMFCHAPRSWRALWDGGVFAKGSVEVQAEVREVLRVNHVSGPGAKYHMMSWCVKRL